MEGSVSLRANRLLGLLPPEAISRLSPHLELVHLPAGTVLHEPGQQLKHAYFPVSGLVGRVAMSSEGKSTELTLCGCDGLIGVSIILGGRSLSSLALVLQEAAAFKVSAPAMISAWQSSEAIQRLTLRYVQAMLQEVIQVALCNKHHTVEQQLSRWLLMAADRLQDPSMRVTQSMISQMLGVRREGITEAAGRLEVHGIIKRVRGAMTIVDRTALLQRCCECYAVIASQFERMLIEATECSYTDANGQRRK